MYKLNKRGQSTVEYVLLVAAVIAVMIAFSTSRDTNTSLQGRLNSVMNSTYERVNRTGADLAGNLSSTGPIGSATPAADRNVSLNPDMRTN